MKLKHLMMALAIFLSLAGTSCEEDLSPAEFTHKYEQTKCSDPWGNDREANAFTQAVIQYLNDKLITVLESDIESENGQSCEACNCLTGSTILIKLSEEDGQKLIDLNEGWIEN
ncbi:MAG: hypothetical protein R8P61_19140 [Bacteroidia bacterium]|nr:hypothetical protein [Bacteroidia bacterium]